MDSDTLHNSVHINAQKHDDDFTHAFDYDLTFTLRFRYQTMQVCDTESIYCSRRRIRQYEKCVVGMIQRHFEQFFESFPIDTILTRSINVNAQGLQVLNNNLHFGTHIHSASACVLPQAKTYRSVIIPGKQIKMNSEESFDTFFMAAREYTLRLKLKGTQKMQTPVLTWQDLWSEYPVFFDGSKSHEGGKVWLGIVERDLSNKASRKEPHEVVSYIKNHLKVCDTTKGI